MKSTQGGAGRDTWTPPMATVGPHGATSSPAPNPGATRIRAHYQPKTKPRIKRMSGRASDVVAGRNHGAGEPRASSATDTKRPSESSWNAVLVVATERSPSGLDQPPGRLRILVDLPAMQSFQVPWPTAEEIGAANRCAARAPASRQPG
jgi:hypothetical protein